MLTSHGFPLLHRVRHILGVHDVIAVEHSACLVACNLHCDLFTNPASVTRFRIALRLKSCSVSPSCRGSYGLPSTAMIRPRPSAAQAFVHSLRMLVVSNTRPCFGSILS